MDCRVRGVGVRPDWPPLIWEAWTGAGWTACELDRDETGGLNKAGDVVLHVPENHETSILARNRAGWLRCRLLVPEEGQPTYTAVPADPVAVGVHHRRHRADGARPGGPRTRTSGVSDGTPAQRFPLQRRPVVPWEEPGVLQVIDETGATDWAAGRALRRIRPRTTPVSTSTRSPARCSSGRRSGRATARCGSTARSRPRARTCGWRCTAPAAACAATSPPARSGCSRPACRTSPGWRTARRRSAGRGPRTSRTPSCAGRWCCAPGAAPSPPRISSS